MKPKELEDVYGKAAIWAWCMQFPIAWENTASASDSRYISFDPAAKDIWVDQPYTEHDPHKEWCMTLENMYDEWHGLRPMFEITPGMSDQSLRVEFSKYMSSALPEFLEKNREKLINNEEI